MDANPITSKAWLFECVTNNQGSIYSKTDLLLLDEIGEIILPESDRSPGARAVGISEFINSYVTTCYSSSEQKIFISGLNQVNEHSINTYGRNFLKLPLKERTDLISEYDVQARKNMDQLPIHFFSLIKQLTILGYFSSEPGVTKAMRYDPYPGGYDGCVDYQEGDRAWYGPLSSIG